MQNAYLKLLNDRLALHLNDDIGLMENWKEQTNLLSSNIGDSISLPSINALICSLNSS